jgi:hypothetical protein
MPPIKGTSTTANTTATTTTTSSRAIASGQNGRHESRNRSHDDYEKDIPDDEQDDGDNMDDNHHHGDEMEEQGENPLIHLTQNQREAAIENLEIESMALPHSPFKVQISINQHLPLFLKEKKLTPNSCSS